MATPNGETGSSDKLKVFISYSRRDSSDFAEELLAGPQLAGFAPFLDRHDIAPGEHWEERLSGLIHQADTVVYVISPEAVKSKRCQWEVDKTLALSKRLMPVVFKPVPEADIPEQLRRRQFVRFDVGPGITRPLGQLADALRQDLDWIREHTRLGDLAARWEARGRPDALLLRGEDIAAAQAWADGRKSDAPPITSSMQAFIFISKQTEASAVAKAYATQRRIIRMQALLSAVLAAVVIALISWINQSSIGHAWRYATVAWPYARANVRPYVLSAEKEQALKSGDSFRECAQDCPEMVVVPPGSFTMGGPDQTEQPQHTVTFTKPFAVSKYEMTFADWDACVTGGGCNGYKPDDQRWGRARRPVINVNWVEAQAYVAWLAEVTGKPYRLVSESEYEYAERAGTTTAYPWGDNIMLNGTPMANCKACGSQWDEKQTAPVGKFAPNKFGLYDMVGNVFEWTEGCYHRNYKGAPADSSAWIKDGDCSSRILRSVSYAESPDDPRRDGLSTFARDTDIGFRVARTLDTP